MTISEIIGEGLHYARTCRCLWLFRFFAGMASGGSGGGQGMPALGLAAASAISIIAAPPLIWFASAPM